MKKLALAFAAVVLLSGCVGFVEGKSKTAKKTTYDMYIPHPAITITGYTSQL